MVMEKPSPQLVGREFVRQYYTLLNKAPDFLHRFYSRNSSYVHGGLDSSGKPEEAVYGQAEIHRKVMSLQFSECSTSIRQVDAQETLSDGIVVQVIGELTTQKREPRRFTQTFVLAPEGSAVNKFYVLNDIFRYDEELLMDSEAELTESEEEEEEQETVEDQILSPEPTSSGCEPSPALSNGLEEQQAEEVEPEELCHQEPESLPEAPLDKEPELEEENQEEAEEPEEELKELQDQRSPTPVSTPPESPPPQTSETPQVMSWALVTRKHLPPAGAAASTHSFRQARVEVKLDTPPLPRDQQRERSRAGVRSEGSTPEPSGGRSSFRGRHPDSHQLFVGNLPHDIDHEQLRDFFTTFGNVLEMRINTKAVPGNLPNFGFVVFDNAETVQRILGEKPIMFQGEFRLNVEEKKTRADREPLRGARANLGQARADSRYANTPRR